MSTSCRWLASVVLLLSTTAYSQVPGQWVRSRVCEECQHHTTVFANGNEGAIVTGSFRPFPIYATTNGGKSWDLTAFDTLDDWLQKQIWQPFSYFPPNLLFFCHEGSTVLGTEGLRKWEKIINLSYVFPVAFKMLTPAFGYRCQRYGVYWQLLETHDSCRTWTQTSVIYADESEFGREAQAPFALIEDSLNIWVSIYRFTSYGSLYHSSNAGGTWERIVPYGDDSLFSPGLITKGSRPGNYFFLNGYYRAVKDGYQPVTDFVYTTDNGASWKSDSIAPARVVRLYNPKGAELWGLITNKRADPLPDLSNLAGYQRFDSIFYSPDYGETWIKDWTTFAGDTVVGFDWPDSNNGYVTVAEDGGISIYRFVRDESAVERAPPFFKPQLLYPNPFRESLSIQGSGDGEVILYDLLGREQLRTTLSAGSISTTGLPNGIYDARILTGAGNEEHQRVVKF